jgi:hypothetical protein
MWGRNKKKYFCMNPYWISTRKVKKKLVKPSFKFSWEPLIFQQNIYRRKIPQQCYRNWPNLSSNYAPVWTISQNITALPWKLKVPTQFQILKRKHHSKALRRSENSLWAAILNMQISKSPIISGYDGYILGWNNVNPFLKPFWTTIQSRVRMKLLAKTILYNCPRSSQRK